MQRWHVDTVSSTPSLLLTVDHKAECLNWPAVAEGLWGIMKRKTRTVWEKNNKGWTPSTLITHALFFQRAAQHTASRAYLDRVRLQVRALKLLLKQSRKRPAVTWNGMKKNAKICTLLYIFSLMLLFVFISLFFVLPSAAMLSAFIWHPLSFLLETVGRWVWGATWFAWSAINTSPAFPSACFAAELWYWC